MKEKIEIKLNLPSLKTKSIDESLKNLEWNFTGENHVHSLFTKEEYFKLKDKAKKEGFESFREFILTLLD